MADQQYVVQVSNSKGFPRFEVFKAVNGVAITNIYGDNNWSPVAGGNPVTFQNTEPDGISTFTLQLSEP